MTAFEHDKPPELAGGIDRTKLLMGLRQFRTGTTMCASPSWRTSSASARPPATSASSSIRRTRPCTTWCPDRQGQSRLLKSDVMFVLEGYKSNARMRCLIKREGHL